MNFFYEAVDETGKTVVGKIEAVNEADVQWQLQQQGYALQSAVFNPGAERVPQAPALMQTQAMVPMEIPVVPEFAPGGTVTRMPVVGGNSLPMGSMNSVNSQGAATVHSPARSGGIILAGNAAQVAARNKTQQVARPTHPTSYTPPATPQSKIGGVSAKDQMLFFQQLTSLVRSGITIHAALDNLAARTSNRALAKTAFEMAERARTGGFVSEVMVQYPRIYPEHVVGLIKAGELGGFLDVAIGEVADNYEQNIALYRHAWIPKVMAIQALFVLALVQPLFPTLFPNAQFGLYLVLALRNVLIAGVVYGGVRIGSRVLQLPQHRHRRDSWALKLEPFGTLQRQSALAKFLGTLGRLYKAGLSPVQAWEGAMQTASNVVIRDSLQQAFQLMERGATFPEAFAATGLFTNSIENLIITGHESGEIVEMLEQATDYYKKQAQDAAGKARFMMLRLGVLAMMIMGGAAVLWMVKSYFKSIFDFAASFEN